MARRRVSIFDGDITLTRQVISESVHQRLRLLRMGVPESTAGQLVAEIAGLGNLYMKIGRAIKRHESAIIQAAEWNDKALEYAEKYTREFPK